MEQPSQQINSVEDFMKVYSRLLDKLNPVVSVSTAYTIYKALDDHSVSSPYFMVKTFVIPQLRTFCEGDEIALSQLVDLESRLA